MQIPTSEYREIKQAWGDWLEKQWDWEWFVSLTFRSDFVRQGGAKALWQKWHNSLVKETGNDVQYVRVTEWQKYRGVPHYHALMLNVKHVRRLKWKERWNELAGFARVLPYDRKKGAAHYLCKYLMKDMGEVVFSDRIQEFRRSSHRPKQLDFLEG